MSGATSGTVTLTPPAVAGTQGYTLPTALPTASGQALVATTAGVMSWSTPSASTATGTTLGTVYAANGGGGSGTGNAFLGYGAGGSFSGYNLVVIGAGSGTGLSNGIGNTIVGGSAATGISSGNNNTAIGAGSGATLTTGSNNTLLGYGTAVSAAGATGQIVIGAVNVTGQADNNVTIGNASGKIYNAYTVSATWTQTSDARLKTNVNDDLLGLSFINRLRPVTFNWKPSNEIDPSLPYYNETNQRDTTTVIHGLIAQEVKAALDAEGCSTFNGWDAGNEDTIQAISREMFISPLIKAIQELTARVAALEAK
jgi:ribosomal protein S8